MSATTHGTTPYYFVPEPSRHPVMAAIGLFFVILGAGQWVNGAGWGAYSLVFGLAFWSIVLFQWPKSDFAGFAVFCLQVMVRGIHGNFPIRIELLHRHQSGQ